jgi:hypothetical protein
VDLLERTERLLVEEMVETVDIMTPEQTPDLFLLQMATHLRVAVAVDILEKLAVRLSPKVSEQLAELP